MWHLSLQYMCICALYALVLVASWAASALRDSRMILTTQRGAVMPTIIDTPGAHTINGSNIDDYIQGNDGADTINGLDGNDTIYGGTAGGAVEPSNDKINGGDGNDKLHGEAGKDTIKG